MAHTSTGATSLRSGTRILATICALALAGGAAARAQAPDAEAPKPFTDTFRRLDEQRWYVHHRRPNGDWAANDWRRSQVKTGSGGLTLTLEKRARGSRAPYSSGEISTLQRYRYGYFEARMRMAEGTGVVNGIFTYVRDQGTASWNEIDIEVVGLRPDQLEATLHVGGKTYGKRIPLGFDSSKDFHTYGFDWQPGVVRWYVDNRMVHEVKGGIADGMVHAQSFFLDVWGSNTLEGWLGKLDPARKSWTGTITCAAYAPSYEGRELCAPPAQ